MLEESRHLQVLESQEYLHYTELQTIDFRRRNLSPAEVEMPAPVKAMKCFAFVIMSASV